MNNWDKVAAAMGVFHSENLNFKLDILNLEQGKRKRKKKKKSSSEVCIYVKIILHNISVQGKKLKKILVQGSKNKTKLVMFF